MIDSGGRDMKLTKTMCCTLQYLSVHTQFSKINLIVLMTWFSFTYQFISLIIIERLDSGCCRHQSISDFLNILIVARLCQNLDFIFVVQVSYLE